MMRRWLAVLAALALATAAGCAGGASPLPTSPAPSASPSAAPPSTPTPAVRPSTPPPPASPSPPTLAASIREIRADLPRARPETAPPGALEAVVAADAAFALRLYGELARETDADFFISPYSLSTALSMTYAGARGRTADQLADALGIRLEPSAWHAGRNAVELDLAVGPGPETGVVPLTLEPTNAIFGQDGFPFEPAFLETLAANYAAGLQAVDFAADPQAARAAVNAWVAERTRERIPQPLPPAFVNEYTRFVLVNAIYFRATWAYPFEPDATKPEPFRRLDDTTLQVPMMHRIVPADFVDGDGWQAVRLPYVGASMLIVVPDRGRFAEVEDRLGVAFLGDVRERLEWTRVQLALPRWESATTVDLPPTLRALGIVDVFDPAVADLTGIAPGDLFVSNAIQQANVAVDEAGTEAAAATAGVGGLTGGGGPARQASLTVDRPFLYLIADDSTGEILFIGRVLEPPVG